MTEKISRRTGILWWTVGLAGALAAPKISKFIFPEKVAKLEFMTSEETLGKIRRFKEERFDRDKEFQTKANTIVDSDPQSPKRTRAKYAQDTFLTRKAKNFPPSIQAKLAVIAPGIAAQESGYNAGLVNSETGAFGVWQVLRSHLNFINSIRRRRGEPLFKFAEMMKMIQSTDFIFYSLDNYFYTEVCVPGVAMAKRYGLDDKQSEDFGIYCMINSYNSGPSRMLEVMKAFEKNFPPNRVIGFYEYTPLALFDRMVTEAYNNRRVIRYREHSSEYVFKVLAGAEYLGYKNLDKAILKRKDLVWNDTMEMLTDYGQSAAVGAGALGAAYLGKVAMGTDKPGSRRSFLPNLGKLIVAGSTVGASAEYINRNGLEGLKNFSWWEKTEQQGGTKFADGSIFFPHKVRTKFSEVFVNKVFFANFKIPVQPDLPRRNYSQVLDFLQTVSKQFPNLSESDLDKLNGNPNYTVSVEVNNLWRLRSIGSGQVDTPRNNMRYALVAKDTVTLIKHITERFKKELEDAGLPKGWFVRPIINSLTRTTDLNKQVTGSSPNSAHLSGLAFDISDTRFDVGFEEVGVKYFTELKNLSESPVTNVRIQNQLRQIMTKILHEVHSLQPNTDENGTKPKGIITYEPRASHYHITTRPVGR